MRFFLLVSVVLLAWLTACSEPDKTVVYDKPTVEYPPTDSVEVVDNYFGVEVADPFRWLENDTAPKVEDWVNEQAILAEDYLSRIPFRTKFQQRLTELINYPRYSLPFQRGGVYYFYKNNGLQDQSVLYRQENLQGEASVFIDPNTWSEDGTVSLSGLSFRKDGRYVGIGVSRSGSDWRTFSILDLENGGYLQDTIRWTKFGGLTWFGEGFFYSGYPKPAEGLEYSAKTDNNKIYYHRLGTPQSQDILIHEEATENRYLEVKLTEDKQVLVLYVSKGTSGQNVYYQPLPSAQDFDPAALRGRFEPLLPEGFQYEYGVADHQDGRLLVHTNLEAPNYRVVSVPIGADAQAAEAGGLQFTDLIPEREQVMQGVSTQAGYLIASYLQDASTHLYQFDYSGEQIREIGLPTVGSAYGLSGYREDSVGFYVFTSFTYPPTIYRYNFETGESTVFREPEVDFEPGEYVSRQVFYSSKDGTQVPMFIVHKAGLQQDQENPTLLTGYGGFNISRTPSFSALNLAFLEQGGVYALANLRGGGEYGEAWHEAGMLENKQNVFDDFIAAAEYLIAEGYTDTNKLAIRGGSNGGLLVGACMTQRPELFQVAIPAVGVLDMLRYHKFTVGWGWAVEYGTADSTREMFDYLYAYSPLHNLEPGTRYPATLIMTADHDDRVVPAHSFKFGAALQQVQADQAPILLRIERKAGHGGGAPLTKTIEATADVFSFIFFQTNSRVDFPEGEVDMPGADEPAEEPAEESETGQSAAQDKPQSGDAS